MSKPKPMNSWLYLVKTFFLWTEFYDIPGGWTWFRYQFLSSLVVSIPWWVGITLICKFCTCRFRNKLFNVDFSPFQSVRNHLWSDVSISFQAQSQFMNICKCTGNSTIHSEYRHVILGFVTCRHVPKTQPPGSSGWPVPTLGSYCCSSSDRVMCFQCWWPPLLFIFCQQSDFIGWKSWAPFPWVFLGGAGFFFLFV